MNAVLLGPTRADFTDERVTECKNIELTHPPNCLEIPCFAAVFVIVVSHVSAAYRSVCASGRFGTTVRVVAEFAEADAV